jgi:hypothetical protein
MKNGVVAVISMPRRAYLCPNRESIRIYNIISEIIAIRGFITPGIFRMTPVERSNGNPGGYFVNNLLFSRIIYCSRKGANFSGTSRNNFPFEKMVA